MQNIFCLNIKMPKYDNEAQGTKKKGKEKNIPILLYNYSKKHAIVIFLNLY